MKGLIIAGGESSRMNADKGRIIYHDQEIRYHQYHLLEPYCDEVYISINPNQLDDLDPAFHCIVDEPNIIKCGPMTAILSASIKYPQESWLVLACDYPLVNKKTIEQLIERRNPQKTATLFFNTSTQMVEPLIGIYEPKALSLIKIEYEKQHYSIRKALEESYCELIHTNELFLQSIDTPSQQEEIKKHLH